MSCALAVCQGGYLGHLGYAAPWAYPQHIPVIGPNGVPVDTPEVQHAKASHLAAHAEAAARSGGHEYGYGVVAPVAYGGYAGYAGYAGYDVPKIGPNGVPLDTAEVAHAKAAHFAAHAEAATRNAHAGWHYRRRRSIYAAPWAYPQHIPVIGPNGVPLDTPEVQHARAAHLAAHASVGSHVAAVGPWSYAAHAPAVITHNGLPLDTPEVAHAKAAHVVAYNAAAVRNSVGPSGHVPVQQLSGVHHSLGLVAAVGPHGVVPQDTPEVAAAKAAHFAAHASVHHHY